MHSPPGVAGCGGPLQELPAGQAVVRRRITIELGDGIQDRFGHRRNDRLGEGSGGIVWQHAGQPLPDARANEPAQQFVRNGGLGGLVVLANDRLGVGHAQLAQPGDQPASAGGILGRKRIEPGACGRAEGVWR